MNMHAGNTPVVVHEPETPVLTAAIVQNIPLLRAIARGDHWGSKAAMAAAVGKDPANLNRAMKLLTEDRVVTGWEAFDLALTDFGRQVLRGIDVVEGKVVLPPGFAMVAHSNLFPNPDNPRKDFDSPAALADAEALRASILEAGVRMPPECYPANPVTGGHMLITGERRWRAVGELIEDGEFPEDYEILVQIKNPDAEEAVVLMMDENIQRRNLTYTEEATQYLRLIETFGWTKERCGLRFKRSAKHVSDYLRLLTIPPEALARLEAGDITYREARALFQVQKPEPALFGDGGLPKAAPAPVPADPRDMTPDQAARMALTLSPRLALMVCELADKTEREPAEDNPGWTVVNETPADSLAAKLIQHGVLMFVRLGGRTLGQVVLKTDGARGWLEDNGFFDGAVARQGLLRQLRTEVEGERNAAMFDQPGHYMTRWIDPPAALAVTPAAARGADPGPEPKSQEPTPGSAEWWAARRDAVEPGSPAPPRDAEPAPKDAAKPAASQPAQPEPTSNAAFGLQDSRAASTLAQDVSERLAQWRADPKRGHWVTLSEDQLARALAIALIKGDVIEALALLAVGRLRGGAMGASQFMRNALVQCAIFMAEG